MYTRSTQYISLQIVCVPSPYLKITAYRVISELFNPILYLNDMLEGLEESITDEVTQSSRSSSASETETNHTKQHVYIGKTPRETTVKEMFALLYNIGVKYIFNIKRVSKYNRQYVSFCVTLQDPHDSLNSLLNLENTGPKLWVCEILCSYIQWCNKSCMHRKSNNSKINIIQIQYIKV